MAYYNIHYRKSVNDSWHEVMNDRCQTNAIYGVSQDHAIENGQLIIAEQMVKNFSCIEEAFDIVHSWQWKARQFKSQKEK